MKLFSSHENLPLPSFVVQSTTIVTDDEETPSGSRVKIELKIQTHTRH